MDIETPGLETSERREVTRRMKIVETFQGGLLARCVRR